MRISDWSSDVCSSDLTQSNGQGHETAYAQIVAARLGIEMDRIRVLPGDTDLVARGNGTGGSRSIPEGGVACDRTAEAVIAKGKRVAAQTLEAAEAVIAYADGRFTIAGTDRGLDLGPGGRAARD